MNSSYNLDTDIFLSTNLLCAKCAHVLLCFSFNNLRTYRHHIYEKPGGPKSIELKEIGPRFELKLFKVSALPITAQPNIAFNWKCSCTISSNQFQIVGVCVPLKVKMKLIPPRKLPKNYLLVQNFEVSLETASEFLPLMKSGFVK